MISVTSAEFIKKYGTYKEAASREPIQITSYGRNSLVVIAAHEYERLKKMDDRIACHPADLPDDLKEELRETAQNMAHVKPANIPVQKF